MSSLYDIRQELLDCVDTDTGEILDIARFDDLQIEYEEKIENIALWIKTLNADAEAYKNEKNAFAEREKKARNKAESLKQYLTDTLNGRKFTTLSVDINWRKSTSVEVDETKLPANWLREIPATHVVDKVEITKALKAGEAIEGATLVERNNIQVK